MTSTDSSISQTNRFKSDGGRLCHCPHTDVSAILHDSKANLHSGVTLLLRVLDSTSTTFSHIASSVLSLWLFDYLQHNVVVPIWKLMSQWRCLWYDFPVNKKLLLKDFYYNNNILGCVRVIYIYNNNTTFDFAFVKRGLCTGNTEYINQSFHFSIKILVFRYFLST